MNNRFFANRLGRVGAIIAALVFVTAAGWSAGRAGLPTLQAQTSDGYDIGGAAKPQPTGQVREFQLVAQEAPWEIATGVIVPAITYNGQVPGPLIRVTEGDTLRVMIKNELKEATSIHWHGLHVPNAMDGVPPFTQQPIEPAKVLPTNFRPAMPVRLCTTRT